MKSPKKILLTVLFLGLFYLLTPLNISSEASERDPLDCLAKNMFYEAHGETKIGKLAVAEVVFNRVKSKHYPNDICSVIYQYKQFSWTFIKPNLVMSNDDYSNYYKLAIEATSIKTNHTNGATHYHSSTIPRPRSFRNLTYIKTIGNHLFYK